MAIGRALLVLVIITGVAWWADRIVRIIAPRGVARAPLLALSSLAFTYLAYIAPWVLGVSVLAGGFCMMRWPRFRASMRQGEASAPLPGGAPEQIGAASTMAFALAGLLVIVCLVRAPWPVYWDEFVWLGKARLGAQSLSVLLSEAMRSESSRVYPAGYPLFYPFAAACLAGLKDGPSYVMAGAMVLELLVYLLFLAVLWDFYQEAFPRRDGDTRGKMWNVFLPWLVLLQAPYALVHLRSVYVDLPIGVLAATLALLVRKRDARLAPYVVAIVLVGLKDEGVAHVAAVTWVASLEALASRDRRRWRIPAITLGVALVVFLAWRVRLATAAVTGFHHSIGLPDVTRLGPIGALIARELLDVTCWGALWILATGSFVHLAMAYRRVSSLTWALGVTVLVQALVLFFAVIAGPLRVFEFALSGTLINRLLMQIAPMVALFVTASCAESLRAGPPLVADAAVREL